MLQLNWFLICVVWFAALCKKWRIYWVAPNSTRQLQEMQRKGRQIYLWRLNGYVCGTDRLEADHSHLWNENLQSPDRAERFSGAPQYSVLTENVRGLPPREGADKTSLDVRPLFSESPLSSITTRTARLTGQIQGINPSSATSARSFTLNLHQHPHSHRRRFIFISIDL